MSTPDTTPEPSPHQLSIHVDFNTLRAKLARAVDRMIRLVSIGFHHTNQPIQEELRMPGSGWLVTFSDTPPWTDEQARTEYHSWLFRTGLRDVMEAFGSFLDECHDITAVISLIRQDREHKNLIGQDFFDQQEAAQKFRRLGIDKKLDKLKPWFSNTPVDVQASVRSINRARNILTHHDGIVPESYTENGTFTVTWFRLQLVTMDEQEREVELGTSVEGVGVGIRAVMESRSFQPSAPLRIQPKDFSGICWTIFTGGEALREQLENDWKEATTPTPSPATGTRVPNA